MVLIAIITNSRSGGGAERAMNLLANAIIRAGEFEVCLIPINGGPSDLVTPNCQIYDINRKWRGGFIDSFRSIRNFQRLLRKIHPDWIIVNCDLPEFFVALSRIKSKIVILDHTTRPWETRKFLGKMIRMILSTRGAFWVNVSSKLPPKESNYLGVIPNIVDQESLIGNPKRNQMTLPPRLVYLGRLSKEKRPDIFLELALSLKYPALVIGDGPLRQDLENSIPPDAEIEFLGHIRSPWELISSNDLVIVTSEYEGDGLVPLEAAALGIPVALRNVSDLRGLGFPPQTYFANIPELGKKIQESGFSGFLLSKDDSYRILKGRASSAVYESWKNLFRI